MLIFFKQWVNQIDVVLGGDNGACRFHAVTQLIFHSKENHHVKQNTALIHVGNIDCNKHTRDILEKTVGIELYEGLRWIAGKMLALHVHSWRPLCILVITHFMCVELY